MLGVIIDGNYSLMSLIDYLTLIIVLVSDSFMAIFSWNYMLEL